MAEEIYIRGFLLREAAVGDEDMIRKFFGAMGPETRALFNRRNYNMHRFLRHLERDVSRDRYFVLVDKEEMVGCLFFLEHDTGVPELGLAVLDALRGRHIGRELLLFAKRYVTELGKGGLLLSTHTANLRAQVLYENMGFSCLGLTNNSTELLYLWRRREGREV